MFRQDLQDKQDVFAFPACHVESGEERQKVSSHLEESRLLILRWLLQVFSQRQLILIDGLMEKGLDQFMMFIHKRDENQSKAFGFDDNIR